jgi:hypothetical protein
MKYIKPTLGFEATYRLSKDMAIMQEAIDKCGVDEELYITLIEHDSVDAKIKALNIFTYFQTDCNNMEVKTDKVKPSQRRTLISEFGKLNKILEKVHMVPSPLSHDGNLEGGGHIHLDYTNLFDLPTWDSWGMGGNKLAFFTKFYQNLCTIANNYPSLIWAMNSPYDHINAKVPLNNKFFNKGICDLFKFAKDYPTGNGFKFKGIAQTNLLLSKEFAIVMRPIYGTFEFRFLTMPTSKEQLMFHIELVESMYKKAFDATEADESITLCFELSDIHKLTQKQAMANLKAAAKYLGLDYKKFVQFGRVKSLKQRYVHELTYNPTSNPDKTYLN